MGKTSSQKGIRSLAYQPFNPHLDTSKIWPHSSILVLSIPLYFFQPMVYLLFPSIGLLPSDIVYSMLLDGTPCHCSCALSAGTRCSLPLPKDIIGDRDGSIFIFEMILTTTIVKLSGNLEMELWQFQCARSSNCFHAHPLPVNYASLLDRPHCTDLLPSPTENFPLI